MKKPIQQCLILSALAAGSATSDAAEVPLGTTPNDSQQYLQVRVDNIVVDTVGLVSASNTLASSIDALARAIEKLSSADTTLTPGQSEALLSAVQSVDRASVALSDLAIQLPQSAQQLTDTLPRVVEDARVPIAELSSGLESASEGILAITESLPQATENAKQLVNSTVDSVLLRATLFAVILFVLFALTLILMLRYMYRNYIDPIVTRLQPLAVAPEHFASLSEHMKQTSENLLALQNVNSPPDDSAIEVPHQTKC